MKSLFNTLFSVLAGACAALLVLKYAAPPVQNEERSPAGKEELIAYAPPPTAGSTVDLPDFTGPTTSTMNVPFSYS